MATYSKTASRYFLRLSIFIIGFVFVYISGCKGRKNDAPITADTPADTTNPAVLASDTGKVKTDSAKSVSKYTDTLKTIRIIDAPVAEYGPPPHYYDDNEDIKSEKNDSTPARQKPDPMVPVTAYGTFPNNYQILQPEEEKPAE